MPIIKKRESYRWTVEHVIAMRDGKPELLALDIEFKALTQSRVDGLLKEMRDRGMPEDEFRGALIVGWHDMKREDGSVWDYNAAGLSELCDMYPGLPRAIAKAWSESVSGARRK